MEDVNSFYSSLLKDELLENSEFQFGQPCVFKEVDGIFHRAMFSSLSTNSGEIQLLLVDKGIYRSVKKHTVYRIMPFLSFPALVSWSLLESVVFKRHWRSATFLNFSKPIKVI